MRQETIQIYYKKLTHEELDEFINMRIIQLTEEYTSTGRTVPEGVDLNPTTKSINSSKSNYLPNWDTYFKRLAMLEYQSYNLSSKYLKG